MANDIIVSEMTSATQINTNDLMIMTQPDPQAETGYSTKKGTVLQVANKMLKGTEYLTDLPDFTDKTVLGGLEELKSDVKSELSNLILSTGTEDELPYQTRPTPSSVGNRCLEMLVGGTVAFNQLVNTGDTSINTTSGRKYLTKINSVWSIIQGGSAVTIVDDSADMVIDLTALFGSTIADYIYTLESGTAGAGVAWFRNYFTADYYPYTANTLMSVKTSAKKIYDANNTLIETYDLSGSRKVHRVFGIVEFDGSADENWQSAGTVGANYRYYIENVGNIKTNNACITNYLEPYNDFDHEFGAYRFSTNGTFIIHDKDKTISDVTALKTYLSNNPLQCGYELATPFDETVTNPELRGIPKLDADNNLYYDGDTCNDFTNPQTVKVCIVRQVAHVDITFATCGVVNGFCKHFSHVVNVAVQFDKLRKLALWQNHLPVFVFIFFKQFVCFVKVNNFLFQTSCPNIFYVWAGFVFVHRIIKIAFYVFMHQHAFARGGIWVYETAILRYVLFFYHANFGI